MKVENKGQVLFFPIILCTSGREGRGEGEENSSKSRSTFKKRRKTTKRVGSDARESLVTKQDKNKVSFAIKKN